MGSAFSFLMLNPSYQLKAEIYKIHFWGYLFSYLDSFHLSRRECVCIAEFDPKLMNNIFWTKQIYESGQRSCMKKTFWKIMNSVSVTQTCTLEFWNTSFAVPNLYGKGVRQWVRNLFGRVSQVKFGYLPAFLCFSKIISTFN